MVAAIEVARETREGPYNGGIELFACGGGSCKVSDLPRPDPAALGGDWGCAPPDVGGGAAGLTSSLVRGPAERLKTVQQVAESSCGTGKIPEKFRGTFRTAATLAREHGVIRGWFTGTGATVAREVPQCAVYFLTYDHIRLACERVAGPEYGTAGIVLAGGSAGVVQWVVTYPLDVVKSKIQAFPPGTYRGMWDCAVKSAKAEGPLVFFRGIEMALLRAFPLHASIFLTCETIHSALARFREDADAEKRWEETGKM